MDVATPAAVRFIHASPNAPAISVIANGNTASPLVPTLSYPNTTPYLDVTGGSYSFAITPVLWKKPSEKLAPMWQRWQRPFPANTIRPSFASSLSASLSPAA